MTQIVSYPLSWATWVAAWAPVAPLGDSALRVVCAEVCVPVTAATVRFRKRHFLTLLSFYRISQNSIKSRFLNWNSPGRYCIKLETLSIQKLFRCQKITQHCSSIGRGQIPYLRLFCCPGICRNTPPGHSNPRSRCCYSQGSGSTCPTSAMMIFCFANSKLFGIMKL